RHRLDAARPLSGEGSPASRDPTLATAHRAGRQHAGHRDAVPAAGAAILTGGSLPGAGPAGGPRGAGRGAGTDWSAQGHGAPFTRRGQGTPCGTGTIPTGRRPRGVALVTAAPC